MIHRLRNLYIREKSLERYGISRNEIIEEGEK